jgi:D-threo-aldose 1-dehydrogenase
LAAAAIQFPLGHPNVASIIPGAVSASEVERNAGYMDLTIPKSLWEELKADQLLASDARVPALATT